MHELSVCMALVEQVASVARQHGAERVEAVVVQVGPLSGVEPPLLEHAYPLAAAGTVAEQARLVIEALPVRIRCRSCATESAAEPNNLVCPACGDWRTELLSGDEMLLAQVELAAPEPAAP
jgi:hydrogenase nickel incorporation protein HypA/HybF